jgi:Amidohydrolase family
MERTMMRAIWRLAAGGVLLAWPPGGAAQGRPIGPLARPFVALDTVSYALRHVRVVDGTGRPAAADWTVVVEDGRIRAVGPAGRTAIPSGARILDLPGRTVLPGLVMLHEHLFYPQTPLSYSPQAATFARLYLAAGVTTLRTAGGVAPTEDINIARLARAGIIPGPDIFVTSPLLTGGAITAPQFPRAVTAEDVTRLVNFWRAEGATSVKVYTGLSTALMAAAIAAAHANHEQVLGHLCSVTFADAARLGIDHVEHGFLTATDFVVGKVVDHCPPNDSVLRAFANTPVDGPLATQVFATLVAHHVGITSTLPVFEIYARDSLAGLADGLTMLVPEWRDRFAAAHRRARASLGGFGEQVLRHEMDFERAFVRAGGTLTVGTDPTGIGGVVPPAANFRSLELLVEAGFTPLEVLTMATLAGARELGIADSVGTIAAGRVADLVVVEGRPDQDIADMRLVSMVIKRGTGFDPHRLSDGLRGRVGAP